MVFNDEPECELASALSVAGSRLVEHAGKTWANARHGEAADKYEIQEIQRWIDCAQKALTEYKNRNVSRALVEHLAKRAPTAREAM